MRLILASGSPRRRELLTQAGFEFAVRAADVDESVLAGEAPEAYVRRLALEKARKVLGTLNDAEAVVLGADTTVVLDGEILGKPVDEADARRMLRALAGRAHQVITGVAVVSAAREDVAAETTDVWFGEVSDAEIAAYVASGHPMDKAGAYGIQGLAAKWIPRIEGCYFNVVGLPVARVSAMLEKQGLEFRA